MDLHDEDIDSLDYEAAVDWLESRSVPYEHLESLDELIDLIKHYQTQNISSYQQCKGSDEYDGQGNKQEESHRVIKMILRRDGIMKKELADMYTEILEFLSGDDIEHDVEEFLNTIQANYKSKLDSNAHELVEDECPIVVAGETGAGKSSLLNLLLGTEVLPLALLSTTSTICCIHNSEDKRFVVDKGVSRDTYSIAVDESGEVLKDRLKAFVCSEESRHEQVCKQIDLYWPIPILPAHVTIVDTPGVGESEEMTKRLLNYLPKAVAFIYVVNSSIAGGIQEDRLLRIIREQQQQKKDGLLSAFDTSNVIFVCNKWDRVEECSEEERVWTQTMAKLKIILPNISDDQVFKMSTTEAGRYLKSGMGNTEKFRILLDGIKRIVLSSLKSKVRTHFDWLNNFLNETHKFVNNRIEHARLTDKQKSDIYAEVNKRLAKLTTESEQINKDLKQKALTECSKFHHELCSFIKSDGFKRRFLTWTDEEAPHMPDGDSDVMRFRGEKVIKAKAERIIHAWETGTGKIEKISSTLTALFYEKCELIGNQCGEIELMIVGGKKSEGLKGTHEHYTREVRKEQEDDFTIPTSIKVTLGVTAPIWIPLGIAGGIIALISSPIWLTSGRISDAKRRQKYNKNMKKFMYEWAEHIYQNMLTQENLERYVIANIFDRFVEKISALCDEFIPKRIATDREQIRAIQNDRRTTQQIIDHFTPVMYSLNDIINGITVFSFKFLDKKNFSLDDIQMQHKIGSGEHSDILNVNWNCKTKQSESQILNVALKSLKQTTSTIERNSLANLMILRRLEHPNIVNVLDFLYLESDDDEDDATDCSCMKLPVNRVIVFQDLCDENLEERIFNDKSLLCSQQQLERYSKRAFQFYISMSSGICDGLSYLHTRNTMHNNLKLSNVLIRNGQPKLHNMQPLVPSAKSGNTDFMVFYHKSPEMLANQQCSHTSDIYSLGVLLWEMWYGKKAYEDLKCRPLKTGEMQMTVKTGERLMPFCDLPDNIRTIITNCWYDEPCKRYQSVELVGRALNTMTL